MGFYPSGQADKITIIRRDWLGQDVGAVMVPAPCPLYELQICMGYNVMSWMPIRFSILNVTPVFAPSRSTLQR